MGKSTIWAFANKKELSAESRKIEKREIQMKKKNFISEKQTKNFCIAEDFRI